MDSVLKRFLTKIGIKDLSPFEEGYFDKLVNDKECNRIFACIFLPKYLHYKDYKNFFDTVDNFVSHGGFGMSLSFKYKDEENEFETILAEYVEANGCSMLDDYKIIEEDKKVLFYYRNAYGANEIYEETRRLKDFLESISSSYSVLTQEKVFIDNDFVEKREEEYEQKSYEAAKKFVKNSSYQPCKLKDIENFRNVIVEGVIFSIPEDKIRKSKKSNKLIEVIEYTDGTDSISSTLFEGKSMTIDQIEKFKVGTKIRVSGRPVHDKYSHDELVIQIDNIEIVDNDPPREDIYPRKRVELHLHTRMSAFDGVASITDYCKLAQKWGHKAIALTDHGVAQSFPEAQKASKATGVKVIYGAELYMIDDSKMKFVYNPCDTMLSKATYVVFDTETTGLSCRYDKLIEFGAIKCDSSGNVLDHIDFFINPNRKLGKFSTETSHITQAQVDNGKPIKKALEDIIEFFGDSILVAHNAEFDYNFVNEALKNNGMETIKNPVIDTLPLARYLFPEMRSHREGAIARKLEIAFDSETAHRADYDASHLATIFSVMLSRLCQNNPNLTHRDLEKLEVTKMMLLSLHPHHVTVYVKNTDGLKDLYRIISYSNTEFISGTSTPLTPKSYLNEHRQNLLIGSACFNGEIWEAAMTKSEAALKKMMEFYDFIEVQPPENHLFEIHTGKLNDVEEAREVTKDLIKNAKSINKIICATGDCHYLNPQDKLFRDVYISAKGLGGTRHPLNLAPRESSPESKKQAWYKNPLPNPDQHFRTTDEMMECFSFLNDKALEEKIVIDNTNLIADMIADDIKPTKDKLYPPFIPGADEKLTELTYKTAKELYGDPLPEVIQQRLETELKGIIDNGYAVIYWLSSDIVRWSNSEGYLIGSRGSVGSSLVATMSGITEVNPLPPHYRCPKCKHLEWADISLYDSGFDLPEKCCPECGEKMIGDGQNIPFATFLGFHAEKVPDIDLNFPSDFQSRAHLHMQEVLNSTGNKCYKAGTIQTTQDKQARGYALGYIESLGMDKSKVRNAHLDYIGSGCIGTKRSTGQHPGGVIVIPAGMEAYDFTPVQYPADDPDSDWETTHFDFHAIHDNVLKFDMLGHVDPVAIRMQCDLCGFSFMDMKEKIPISDPEAKSLLWSADALHLKNNVLQQETGALGLPEFGTENGRRVLLETKPRSFSDLVRISGLSHGTDVFAGNAEDLITKEGFKLGDVIACRDDIMTVLHDKYGVENGDAFKIMEFTRKGMFVKSKDQELKDKYDTILKEHNVPDWYINSCHKIQYMFPKGHAVAYVTNCIRCAWFKVHKPLAYYATYFTLRCDSYDIENMMKGIKACLKKREDILNRQRNRLPVTNTELACINAYESTIEMYDRGMSFAPIHVNTSEATRFTIDEKHNKVIPSLTCVNNLGESLAVQITNARKVHPFTSVDDLRERARVGDKMIEVLRSLGALDGVPESDQISLFEF